MQGGDISNEVVPRLLIEFEGLLAHPVVREPEPPGFLERLFGGTREPQVVWDLDDLVVRVIEDLTWRLGQEIDVITKQGPEFASALAKRLDAEEVHARRVWSYEPRVLARRLASMHHVAAVYTPDPHHVMLYGTRGRLVTPDRIPQIGRF